MADSWRNTPIRILRIPSRASIVAPVFALAAVSGQVAR
jgi:hypothetical protein